MAKAKAKNADQASKAELRVRVVSEIVNQLVKAHDDKKDINLNKLKGKISSKHGLNTQPKLVDIIHFYSL